MDTAPYQIGKILMSTTYGKHGNFFGTDAYYNHLEERKRFYEDMTEKWKTSSPPDPDSDDEMPEMEQAD